MLEKLLEDFEREIATYFLFGFQMKMQCSNAWIMIADVKKRKLDF